ncbi:hypothetical protein Y032_0581g276 [Ancylostoma ceylanicum]|uniref:Uncharacterized protein n=1 Tax=Ancylostoma ceylanicum TaxID=53326 RepID=A0A016WQ47_9BILA|nr:hypothetical protein Y032_0581g276 [Ancylostoma ceylanicum]
MKNCFANFLGKIMFRSPKHFSVLVSRIMTTFMCLLLPEIHFVFLLDEARNDMENLFYITVIRNHSE